MFDLISKAAAQTPTEELQQLQKQATALQNATTGVIEQPFWSITNAMTVSCVVLLFGAASIGIAAYLIRHERNTQRILRVVGTILILTFAVFLIVAGYSDQQIAPAMGLLGTIAGYLLGRDSGQTPPATNT